MPRSRLIGLLLILVSAAVLAAAIPAFVSRARAFNQSQHFHHFKKAQISDRTFTAHGRTTSITDVLPGSAEAAAAPPLPPKHSYIRLTYGDTTRLIPIKTPPAENLPDLLIYGDWLAMLRIVEVTASGDRLPPSPAAGGGEEGDRPVAAGDRYILVIRNTPEGYDPETWGSVRRREWTFNFYELLPDGTIAERAYRFPLPERAGMTQKRREARLAALPAAIRTLPELEERTIEYEAALHAIPKLQVPNYRFKNTAFNAKVMGWTFPAAALSVLALLAGLGLFFGPKRVSVRSPGEAR